MVSLVYFALLFLAGRKAMATGLAGDLIVVIALIGTGVMAVGLWVAYRSARFSFLGWWLFAIGYLSAMLSMMGIHEVDFGISFDGGVSGFDVKAIVAGLAPVALGLLALLVILVGAILYLGRKRVTQNQEAMLRLLTIATRNGMPLAPGVRALAGQVSGIYRVWCRSLADLLESGLSLPEAIDSVPKVVPRETLVLIHVGDATGRLDAGLEAGIGLRDAQMPVLQTVGSRIGYLCWLLIILESIVAYCMVYLLPRLQRIFADYRIPPPEPTRWILAISENYLAYGWILAIAQMVFLLYLPVAVRGWSSLGIPGIDQISLRRHAALVLRGLVLAVDAGRPLAVSLEVMGRTYPTRWIRRRIRLASGYVDQGVDWTRALREFGLLNAHDVAVLDSAERAGNLGWALRELASSIDRRWGYRLVAWTQVLFFLTIVGLGFMVMILCLGYFAPLVALIGRLSE
jgi:type II secretory pathway component PulF